MRREKGLATRRKPDWTQPQSLLLPRPSTISPTTLISRYQVKKSEVFRCYLVILAILAFCGTWKPAKSVSLPEEKCLAIMEKLTHASSEPSISAKDLHSLAGSLSTIVVDGRVNLRRNLVNAHHHVQFRWIRIPLVEMEQIPQKETLLGGRRSSLPRVSP
jgi:hypothetical protein